MFMRKIVRSNAFLLAFIILVSITSQALFIRPIVLSDQMIYYRFAVNFPRLPETPDHWSMRLGLIIPTAVLYRILGHCELTYYFLPFFSTIILVISTYLIGQTLFNKRVGLVSALWISWLPYFLLESGNLLPDITASACIIFAIALLLLLKDCSKSKLFSWANLFIGALFGWAYLTKEYFAIFTLIIPLIFWIFNIPFRYLISFTIGVLLIISIEFTINFVTYGNPLLRLSTTQPRETLGFIESDIIKIVGYPFILLRKYNGEGTIFISLVGLIGLFIMVIRKSRRHLILLAWIGLIYIFFTSLGLLPVIFNWENIVLLRLHKFRYWIPILPPLIISGISAMDSLIINFLSKDKTNEGIRIIASGLMIVGLLIFSSLRGINAVKDNKKFVNVDSAHYFELREYLVETSSPDAIMWIIRDLKIGYEYLLPIYSHDFFGREIWQGTQKYINTNNEFLKVDEIASGYILVDRVLFNPDSFTLPDYLSDPPATWQLVFESSNSRIAIYQVD